MKRNKNYYNGYENISVTLKDSFEPKIGKMIWEAYRMTWTSLQDKEYDPTDDVVRDACLDVVMNRALPTPKESIKFQFEIKNISRVCLAQITRGRIGWWYNVESQMPEYMNHGVTIPKNIYENDYYRDQIIRLVKESQRLYDMMASDGFPPQDLRYLVMHGQQTSLIADTNFAALPGFFAMRTENGLTDELNYVARLMKYRISKAVDNAPDCDSLDITLWSELLSQLDTLGYKQKKCLIYDRVFGNTGRYPSGEGVCENPDFDFKKSAWYLELQELPEHLLFDREKEMIDEWKKDV